MGNRACVVFTDGRKFSPAIQLRCNGGPESVYALLNALLRYEVFSDIGEASARFTQLVGNYIGGPRSVALMSFRGPLPSSIDPGDNGIYLVTLKRHSYGIRRWINGKEQDTEFLARERTKAAAHRYHTDWPTIDDRIDDINLDIFLRNELTSPSAGNDHVGG